MVDENVKENNIPCRISYWSEIDDQEKIRRLREQVKIMKNQMHALQETINMLLNHNHDKNRGITIPLDVRNIPNKFDYIKHNEDEVYF